VTNFSWPAIVLGAIAGLSASVVTAGDTGSVKFLDQGWSREIRELFYFTPQGSRIVPYAWFMALESTDGRGMFSDSANLARYGFIAGESHPLNPDGLPIGFAIEPLEAEPAQYAALTAAPYGTASQGGPYLGLTCAACHTANVTVEGQPIRIDGAPAHLDFDRFYADIAAAVSRTFFDPAAFERFAARVLKDPSPTGAAELRLQLAEFEARIAGEAAIRRPALESGFGRVDALTQIVNALAVTDQGDPLNLRPVDVPTSYPPLWLTPELEFVQWNPIAASPIGRNGGEVLGVFGTATLTGDPQGWFASSLRVRNLHALETWVADLDPPKWDEAVFGPIDRDLAARGEALFAQHCAGCHNAPPYRRTDPVANFFGKTFIEIGRVDFRKVGTDPSYVASLLQRLVRTNAASARAHEGAPVVPAASYFLKTVGAIVTRAMNEAGLSDQEKAAFNGFRLRPPNTPGGEPQPYLPPSVTDLKAGPLPGVWTTGPYLHNGSVPTVHELLSPVEERRKVFWTGGRELDRDRLGFVSEDAPGRFRFDTARIGNRNTGHLYPRQGLSPDERQAVIEYLKIL
jgi:mono/diheme cytochrome c family protein